VGVGHWVVKKMFPKDRINMAAMEQQFIQSLQGLYHDRQVESFLASAEFNKNKNFKTIIQSFAHSLLQKVKFKGSRELPQKESV